MIPCIQIIYTIYIYIKIKLKKTKTNKKHSLILEKHKTKIFSTFFTIISHSTVHHHYAKSFKRYFLNFHQTAK